ncbi:MAG TPA: carbohydrate kinase [Chloroflexi bacterium]|nr:carbohydrate kinase [Chloroflexota bacterium]
MDVVTLGELLVDMFPAELGRSLVEVSAFRPKPGGAPANVAVAVARLGRQSAFIGKVGDEAFGHYLVDVLRREGVETRGVRFDPEARTTMAFIAMPDENTAEFVFYRNPGADTLLRSEELDRDLLGQARAFHFGSLSLTHEPARSATLEAIRLAREAGALISFDVNYRPALWSSPQQAVETIMETLPLADLIKVNEVEVALLSGRDRVSMEPGSLGVAAKALIEKGPQACVVTLGPHGSFFQTAEAGEHVPGFRVETVDAVGCGDAFVAGLLCRLVGDGNWRDRLAPDQFRAALRYANAVGALTSLTQGVIPALPTAARVDEFLSRHSAGEGR